MIADKFKAAEQAFARGDMQAAGDLCAQILIDTPTHPAATLLSGLVQVRKGEVAAAIETLRRALTLSPNDFIGTTWLQVALRKEGHYTEAIELGERARTLWPGDPEVLVNLSHAYLGAGEVGKGAACLIEASKAQPRNGSIRLRLGLAYEHLGRDDDAAEEYRKAIKYQPHLEDGYIRLGRLLISHGNFTQTLELCRSGLKVLPRSAQLHLLFAQALRGLRDDEPARKHLLLATSLDESIVVAAAMWLHEDGRFEEAADLFLKSIEQRPGQGVAYFGLLKGKKATDADRAMLERMEENLKIPGLPPSEQAALHYGLGKAADDLGNYESAMRHYDAGNRLNYEIHIAGRGYDPNVSRQNCEKIIRMFTPEFMEQHKAVGTMSNVPIFIVGMIRSGTTLVEQIIASHPEVGGAGEQRFWVNEVPKVVDLESGTLDEAVLVELRDRYLQVLRSFQPDSARITDKMPMNFYCAGVIHLAFPNSPIVHIERNPVDTALSIYMTDLAKSPEFAHSKRNIVSEYQNYQRIMEHWQQVIPSDRLLTVKYEDLVSDQECWTRRMLDFCSLDWNEDTLAFYANERAVSTPSSWQVRQPIFRTSVNKWKYYEPWLDEFSELLC